MRHLEAGRDERALAIEERRQASMLSFWPVKGDIGGGTKWGIELVNASDAPVFGFELERQAGLTRKRKNVPAIKARADVLPPGRYFCSDDLLWPSFVKADVVLEPTGGNSVFMPSIRFVDSDGRPWVRDGEGQLLRSSKTGRDSVNTPKAQLLD
ncbi:hypothetical protein ACW4FP_04765 [Paenarthrobacter ureafaciens]